MANFPNSVTTFASRSAGQKIASAHMNSVQDEINAIEDGLLNATAQLNLNSTITLGQRYVFPTAAAASTGQTLTVDSISGSTHTLKWAGAAATTLEAVRAVMESTLAITDGATVGLNFTLQDYITNSSLHSTASNSSRFVPQSTGVYRLTAQVRFSPNSTGVRGILIKDSSGGNIANANYQAAAGNSQTAIQAIATKRFDVTGGHLKVEVFQAGGSTLSIQANDTWVEFSKL